MSDEKNLGEDLNDMLGDAKEGAKKAADKAGELAGDAKEAASELVDDAKEATGEFVDSAKEAFNSASGENKKVMAGVLAILLGAFGVHKFILGYTKEGVIQILLSFLCGLGGLIALVEGIIYLTKSDEEFYNTYQVGKKPWL